MIGAVSMNEEKKVTKERSKSLSSIFSNLLRKEPKPEDKKKEEKVFNYNPEKRSSSMQIGEPSNPVSFNILNYSGVLRGFYMVV